MDNKNKLFNNKYSLTTSIFVYFFFVIYQYLKISSLNLAYLGEKLDTTIVPYYTLVLLIIPIIVYVFVYLPGLFIVRFELRINVRHITVSYLNKFNRTFYKVNYSIKSVFETRYKVLLC